MALMNEISGNGSITRDELKVFTLLLNPFAPHVTEEVWAEQDFEGMVCQQAWPVYDEAKCVDALVEVVVQVNGKVRARVSVPATQVRKGCWSLPRIRRKFRPKFQARPL